MIEVIRARFAHVRYSDHALAKLLERGIAPAIIREAVFSAKAVVIEERPDDPRGPKCLVLGWYGDRRPLHVLFALDPPLWVITAYDPSADEAGRWETDYRTRRPRSPEGGS